jgi:hypothetical protein
MMIKFVTTQLTYQMPHQLWHVISHVVVPYSLLYDDLNMSYDVLDHHRFYDEY